jgi:uncharacterized protein YdeI (YjbR/CyaY-like superfamily)
MTDRPTSFATPAKFRAWLEKHHAKKRELLVGYYKRGSGKPSITWPESVDEALCFGWIDGVRRSLDDERYTIRFTPRKAKSNWSAINIRRAKALSELGKMRAAGLAAFEKRSDERSAIYSYEQRHAAKLEREHEQRLRANPRAWKFFQAQAPWYRRAVTHWIVSAKKPETRASRLATLIRHSAAGEAIPPLRRPERKTRARSK